MINSFQKHHLFRILSHSELEEIPLDVFLARYFRAHKAAGANDRRLICETLYGLVRWRGLLDHLLREPPSWESRLALFSRIDPKNYHQDEKIPPHIRVSFPKEFYEILEGAYGEKRATELCLISNEAAPTTIRVNESKISREKLFERWKEQYPISLCRTAPYGITFHKRINFFTLPEFKEGLFEVQDEGSQLVASLVEVIPGQQVLDFCSGSGGKTLAFAPRTQNRGQIYLHDIRPRALMEAKKRLKRAGIQNAQPLSSLAPHKENLKGKMDWVLVDLPCSGSGTLRRNPDMKWKFNRSLVDRLVHEQREIFSQALEFLAPHGRLVYSTCSILPQENEEQVAFFESHFPVICDKPPFHTYPQKGGPDGFFAATFRKK